MPDQFAEVQPPRGIVPEPVRNVKIHFEGGGLPSETPTAASNRFLSCQIVDVAGVALTGTNAIIAAGGLVGGDVRLTLAAFLSEGIYLAGEYINERRQNK